MLEQEEQAGQKLACGKYKKTVGINRENQIFHKWLEGISL